jgi:hypothetical protein
MKLKNITENDGPCWKGYQQIGTKMKNGKEVPNCVPKNEVINKTKNTMKEENPLHKSAPGEWVAFLSTNKGKKLLKTFNTARGAKTWLSKNADKLLNTANTVSVGAMTKQQWDEREAKWAIESVNEDCGCGDVKLSNPYSLKEFIIKEGDYKFGEVEYTAKNMGPVDIMSLAFAYHQTPINKLVSKNPDSKIRVVRDLGRLIGKNPMNPTEKGKESAWLLYPYKGKLVSTEEYKQIYTDLTDKLKKVSLMAKKVGGVGSSSAAKAAAKADMKEAKKYDIGSGYMGNGLTIWNRAEEKNGDYKIIAHITKDGKLSIRDKQLPDDLKKMFQIWADSMAKGNMGPKY